MQKIFNLDFTCETRGGNDLNMLGGSSDIVTAHSTCAALLKSQEEHHESESVSLLIVSDSWRPRGL